ncbi:glycosyltransferase family 4 protein [Algibacter mikhailovii]|uniref:glycosyltransferase family 4 protein n=1 Tax=Algibacter mikhailovii TaxID=425498 RepID=UPI002494E825|nr:glycosyltransferase family 4 protein [Algibacter mikhailovii]
MKVLCFTNSSYKYNQSKNKYYGAGWIDSLLMLMEKNNSIQLGISFFHEKDGGKVVRQNITYYPTYKEPRKKNRLKTIWNDWKGEIENNNIYDSLALVVADFKPDIIQVFGTEGVYAGIQKYTDTPVLVHIQGVLNPYYNTYFPINQSKWNFLLNPNYLVDNILGKGPSFSAKRFRKMAQREEEHFKHLKYVSGRTAWDHLVAKISNPDVEYFHVDEILRPIFYENEIAGAIRKKEDTLQLVSTISPTIYKGIDVILKTAKLLTDHTNIKFSWKVIGLDASHPFTRHYEKSLKIFHKEVNVEFIGIRKSEAFINQLKQSDIFIHPSYIDNSPNSVCEAQILGLPVIACNVGGLSTLISDNETGFLVPSNGIYEIVNCIKNYRDNLSLFKRVGENAREVALKRHNKNKIIEELIDVYKKIVIS